ncbi:MAG: restriction endonuclease subunit S [Sphaerochaetaceae bacterium]|nr:restriction endonuclease subunit S [Sphaerochaetaceae bacterium]
MVANELCTNQGFKSLIQAITDINYFMHYCLTAFTPAIQARVSGTTFKEISGTEFAKTLVPIPPLAEQHRIVQKIEDLILSSKIM